MEQRFWLRWFNNTLNRRGLVAQKVPEDLANGSLLLHFIECVDLESGGYISGHILYPTSEEDNIKNYNVIEDHLKQRGIALPNTIQTFLSNQDSSFDLIRLIANGCVYFQSFRPKQSTIIQSKLRAYLREDLNDTTIQSFDCIKESTILKKLLEKMYNQPHNDFSLFQLFGFVTDSFSTIQLFNSNELEELYTLSNDAILQFLIYLYHPDSILMKKRILKIVELLKPLNDIANRVIKQTNSQYYKSNSTIIDCTSLLSDMEYSKEKDTILSCINELKNSLTVKETQQIILELVQQASIKILHSHKQQEYNDLQSISLQEKIQVLNSRYQRELNSLRVEKQSLEDRLNITKSELQEQQKKSDHIISLTRNLVNVINEDESIQCSEFIKESIFETMIKQSEMIEEQQEMYDRDDIEPLQFHEIVSQLTESCRGEDDEINNEKIITIQHFGYLHEIIRSQKEKINLLETKYNSSSPGTEEEENNIPKEEQEKSQSDNLPSMFSKKQKEIQIENERESLTAYLERLRSEITSLKTAQEKLNLNK